MKKLIILILTIAFAGNAMAQIYPREARTYDFELSDMAERLTPVLGFNRYMHDDQWIWKEGRSSALREKGKPEDFYEISKLSDMDENQEFSDVSTAWVEGAPDDGIGEWVIIPIEARDEELEDKLTNGGMENPLEVELLVNNGYQQSEDLYQKNNRVKDARISVYAAAMSFGQDDAYLLWNPEVIYQATITLNDDIEFSPAGFNSHYETFSFQLPEKYRDEMCQLYLKLEILSVYKGSKYSDTCISNMWARVSEAEAEPDFYSEEEASSRLKEMGDDAWTWIEDWESKLSQEMYIDTNPYHIFRDEWGEEYMDYREYDGIDLNFLRTYDPETDSYAWFLLNASCYGNGGDYPSCLPFRIGDHIETVRQVFGEEEDNIYDLDSFGHLNKAVWTSNVIKLEVLYSDDGSIQLVYINKTGW